MSGRGKTFFSLKHQYWLQGTSPSSSMGKGKAVPIQAWRGPEGSRKLRFLYFMTTAQEGGKVVSLTHCPPLPPGNSLGTHFFWRLSQPQGHSAIGRIMSMKNSNDTTWNRTTDLPICSTAPSPLCHSGPPPVQWLQGFFPTSEVAEALSWPVILKQSRRWESVELYVWSHCRPSRHRQGQLHFYLFSLCSLTCLCDVFYLSAPNTNWNLCCSVFGLLDNSLNMDKPKCETSSHNNEISAVKLGSVRAGWVHQSDRKLLLYINS